MHLLFESLSLSPRRWSVVVHYFTVHYTDRLRRHGNVQGMCSEGGEHLHVPHTRLVVRRPSPFGRFRGVATTKSGGLRVD